MGAVSEQLPHLTIPKGRSNAQPCAVWLSAVTRLREPTAAESRDVVMYAKYSGDTTRRAVTSPPNNCVPELTFSHTRITGAVFVAVNVTAVVSAVSRVGVHVDAATVIVVGVVVVFSTIMTKVTASADMTLHFW